MNTLSRPTELYMCLSCYSSANFSRSLNQVMQRIERMWCVFCNKITNHEKI